MFAEAALLTCFLSVAHGAQQNVATTPADRLTEQWWKDRHDEKLAVTRQGGIDVAFLGDSITHGWEGSGKKTWDYYYGKRRAANFGFSGDRTEHVLWRLDHGELIPAQPKVVVIMIGTNNIGHGSSNAQQTADGVAAIVTKLQSGIKGVKVLLLGIFPRGIDAQDKMRQDVAKATDLFKGLADGEKVVFLDIGKYFLRPGSEMRTTMLPDLLHPNEDGYRVWGHAMEETLARMLGEKPIPPPDWE